MSSETIENNIVGYKTTIRREERERMNGHKSAILWFTGLPSSGKSTLANAMEERLHRIGCRTFVLDGDNVRQGLSSDLGFSMEHRTENIRRIAEVSKLFVEAGIISLIAFISPFKSDRGRARKLVPQGDFIEIYCKCSLEICEQRDVKGLYQRARSGKIKEFTGISSPYELPDSPELEVNTEKNSVEACVTQIMNLLYERGIIKADISLKGNV